MRRKNWELKGIFWIITLLFVGFLAAPILLLLGKSLLGDGGLTGEFYVSVVTRDGFLTALGNSFAVAAASAVVATIIAFLMAYAVHYTELPKWAKRLITAIATLPMFLPTITYGFAIIYSFGRQGLLTRLLGRQFFDIYGFGGLLVGYVIYTIPVAFLLIHNTMGFVDKKTIIVSKVMGDRDLATFWIAILRPLLGTLAGAFIQAFFLCFTDFGIPASVGGGYEVIATLLYNQMLGGIPDFNRGAVIAMIMLIPSIGSICILQLLERFNIRYTRISQADLRKKPLRDTGWGISSTVISVAILSIFAVIFVVPLVEEWPYQTGFSLEHFAAVFTDSELITVYWHSLVMALLTAFLGTLAAYGAALITARSTLSPRYKRAVPAVQAGHREHRPGDQRHPRHGAGRGLHVPLLRHRAAEHPAADDPVQHRPLLLHPLSDDEELPVQDERRLGDHRHAHGGQLAPDHPPGGHPQRPVQPHRGVQLLLHQLHGHHQRPYLHRRGPDHGPHHHDQAAAVREPLQRGVRPLPADPGHQPDRQGALLLSGQL